MTDEMKQPSYVSKRDDVLAYTHLLHLIADDTGLKVSQVRRAVEALQREAATFLRDKPGGRVHIGRLCTLLSRMTKERTVNHPQKPGETLISAPHLVMRVAVGAHTQGFLKGERPEWDAEKEDE